MEFYDVGNQNNEANDASDEPQTKKRRVGKRVTYVVDRVFESKEMYEQWFKESSLLDEFHK